MWPRLKSPPSQMKDDDVFLILFNDKLRFSSDVSSLDGGL